MRTALERSLPWMTGPVMLVALGLVFLWVPTERVQGAVQRIFYFHVPSAWMAFLGFGIVCVGSAAFLGTGRAGWDRLARASGEVGMVFCTLVLLTGPIWARPIWGVWWTWDPRITMTLILWTIYAAYLMLRSLGRADEPIGRYAAVLGIVGAIDIPLIIVSVRLWRGIHPTVLESRGGGGLDPSMQLTLLATTFAFTLLFAWMVSVRARVIACEDEIEALHHERFA